MAEYGFRFNAYKTNSKIKENITTGFLKPGKALYCLIHEHKDLFI